MRRKIVFSTFLLLGIALGSCGVPSPGALPTAPPATLAPSATPPPPTDTPILYNLVLMVKSPDGQPVPDIQVNLGEASTVTDSHGTATFAGLTQASLKASLQGSGYFPQELDLNLQPGENSAEATLEPDPNGLLPQNACRSEEKLLYLDDFQDGAAQGWDVFNGPTPGWSVGGDPQQPDNLVIMAESAAQSNWAVFDQENTRLNNAVWRFRLKLSDNSSVHLNFRMIFPPGGSSETRYFLAANPRNAGMVRRENSTGVDLKPIPGLAAGDWHRIEMGYFDGTLTLFVDGEEQLVYTDPQPWQDGTVGLEVQIPEGESIYFDNLSLCELSAPPQAIPRPKTGFDLTLTITDAQGNPVTFGQATLNELGKDPYATQSINAEGVVAWTDLPGETASVSINAPGYSPAEQTFTLQKGLSSTETIVLEAAPFGLLPQKACAAGETLVYLEDFQDNKAQGWPEITAAVELNAQNGWTIQPEETGNILLMGANAAVFVVDYLSEYVFDNAVWRIMVKAVGTDADAFFNWRHSSEQGDWRYYIPFGGQQLLSLHRLTSGQDLQVGSSAARLKLKVWNWFEISTFNGLTEVWLNGRKLISYTDPQPLPPGSIGLELHLQEGRKTVFSFDNMSVCELSTSFASIPMP